MRRGDERHEGVAVLGVLSGAGVAGSESARVDSDSREAGMREELLALKTRLEQLRWEGKTDEDIDAAYWTVDRALEGRGWGTPTAALEYGREVVARYDQALRKKVELQTRALTKEEHDALLASDAPKSVSREDYERMMREAQE